MFRIAVRKDGDRQGEPVDALAAEIGRLLRHPAYRRAGVVSPMLLRHLPWDGGYAWRGEGPLRDRLAGAGLGRVDIDHMLAEVRSELFRLRRPGAH